MYMLHVRMLHNVKVTMLFIQSLSTNSSKVWLVEGNNEVCMQLTGAMNVGRSDETPIDKHHTQSVGRT